MTTQELLRRAHTLAEGVIVNPLDDGFEVMWLRRYSRALASVQRLVTDTIEEGLSLLIEDEEALRMRYVHGIDCPCEDCCNDRVDRTRSGPRP